MSKPMIRIHDLSDDSVIDREMNDIEYANYLAQQEANARAKAEADAAAAAKEALLTKLGITADEAKLLLS